MSATATPPDITPLRAGDVEAMDAALAKLDAAVIKANALAAESDNWFQHVLGNESAVSAAKSDAHSTGTLRDALRGRRDRIVARGYSHADAIDVITSSGYGANLSGIEEVANLTDASNAATTVAKETAADIKEDVEEVAEAVKFGLPVVLGIVALVVVGVGVLVYRNGWPKLA